MSAAKGLWSKAQKDGLYQLLKYARTHNEADYENFEGFMKVNQGDHKARMELSKGAGKANLDIVREGFIEGRNDPDDVDGMIKLFLRFHSNKYISRAIVAWTKAEEVISGIYGPRQSATRGNPYNQPYSQQRVDSDPGPDRPVE
jgi:hypothetical protein